MFQLDASKVKSLSQSQSIEKKLCCPRKNTFKKWNKWTVSKREEIFFLRTYNSISPIVNSITCPSLDCYLVKLLSLTSTISFNAKVFHFIYICSVGKYSLTKWPQNIFGNTWCTFNLILPLIFFTLNVWVDI